MTTPTVTSFVAASYVRDLDRSRAFYRALGFVEHLTGSSDVSAWSTLQHGRHTILLATTRPAPAIPQLPLLFYFFVDDLDIAVASLEAAGYPVERVGFPPHALGGEAKTLDPDGNTVLVGQRERSAGQPPQQPGEPADHFSLLREAAALARQQDGQNRTCQLDDPGGRPCDRPAEVKLADAWGETAWACIPHAEQALINAPGVFIAHQDDRGLAAFRAGRRPA
jgi:predicted enzyme related to lactoylglutathione lyase